MESLRTSFERELKNKLSQKSSGSASEETVLMKSFKYFDLNNNGTVEPDEFAKAIEKIGIMIPTRQDLDALFGIYDADRSGAIDYKEFSGMLFQKSSGGGSPSRPGTSAGGNQPEALAERLKQKLASRGARGIIGLGRQFKIMDDNGSRTLDMYEFTKAMKDYMLGFSEGEIQTLFTYFDVDRSGAIDYNEFIRAIRGVMNPSRRKLVAQAYAKLDRDHNGWIDINDIKGVYSAKTHPDVLSGKKTEEQILLEFLETFEAQHNMRTNGAPDHVVTKEEFDEYYNNVSASVDNDQYFELMMNNAWKINDGDKTYGKAWANKDEGGSPQKGYAQRPQTGASRGGYGQPTGGSKGGYGGSQTGSKQGGAGAGTEPPMNYSEKQLMEVFRTKLAKRGSRGIAGLGRQFKIADDDNSKNLNVEEFQKALHDFRIGLSKPDGERLFRIFDRDGSGTIDYDEFLRGVRGEMNSFRVNLCKKAFTIMDKDRSGVLDVNDIRQNYNAKMHPDVKSGKKTEDEILMEFLDTFEIHYGMSHQDTRNGQVEMDEWIEYYNNVSMSVDNDQYFELMMNNTWNLDGSRVTKKGWAGEQ